MDSTSIQTLHTIVVDSVEYIRRTDVLEFYSDLVDKQANQFTILLTALGVAFGSWIVGTWVWNIWGAKRQIKDEVSKNVEDARLVLAQSLQNSIDKQISDKAIEIKESIQGNQDNFEQKYNDLFEKFKNSTNINISKLRIGVERLFEQQLASAKDYYSSLTWAMNLIEVCKKINEDELLGYSIERVYNILKNEDIKDTNNHKEEWIQIIQENVPRVLSEKKKELISMLQNLPSTDIDKEKE